MQISDNHLIINEIGRRAAEAVEATLEANSIVLCSGGIDSSILEAIVTRAPKSVRAVFVLAGITGSADLRADIKGPYMRIEIDERGVASAAKELEGLVKPTSLAAYEDCLAFHLMFSALAKREDLVANKLVLAANGPDELFCGYDRFRRILDLGGYRAVENEIGRALKTAYHLGELISRIAKHSGFRFEQPFLEPYFVDYCKQIPAELKIYGKDDMLRKRIWREYGRSLGLGEEVVMKPKKAMQYSMGIHRLLARLFKENKLVEPKFDIMNSELSS
jgi:asparagine synthetase B (glutamine-hydrolysing)